MTITILSAVAVILLALLLVACRMLTTEREDHATTRRQLKLARADLLGARIYAHRLEPTVYDRMPVELLAPVEAILGGER